MSVHDADLSLVTNSDFDYLKYYCRIKAESCRQSRLAIILLCIVKSGIYAFAVPKVSGHTYCDSAPARIRHDKSPPRCASKYV